VDVTDKSTLRENPAVRAEPTGIGSALARDPLAREVKLLGALLGQVIEEQAGRDAFDLVERTRRRAIAARQGDVRERDLLEAELDALDIGRAEIVARAFNLYFQLVNLAEERHRIRVIGRRERAARGAPVQDSVAGVIGRLVRRQGLDATETLIERLRITPVLTAHPTEARRRTLLIALRRVAREIERLDDPRLTPDADRDVRRRLREEIALLWRTAEVRSVAPTPLDEVRTAMVFFDETLFSLVPTLARAVDAALDVSGSGGSRTSAGPPTGARPPRVPAFVHWSSWIGGDRDGNPSVTATVTEQTLRIHADHVLRGLEAVATRLMQTIAVHASPEEVARPLATRLARDADAFPDLDRELRQRFPDEPYRERLGAIAERLRRTRAHLSETPGPTAGRYDGPDELDGELAELQATLIDDGLGRVAWGGVQDFRWQVQTFGFHLASVEIRQHASVHRAALAAIREGASGDRELVPGVSLDEVLETFRSVARIHARFGSAAVPRAIVSFTSAASDVFDVLDLARLALGEGRPPDLEIVPLFESAEALRSAGALLDEILDDTAYRAWVEAHGNRQEVMLGYSDSNKESGYLAANWLLLGAQAGLVASARRHGVELTLFHGRGGAIGRGGGRIDRAVLGQAPGSIDARLKVTEQGEVVAAHYSNPAIARRHLELVTGAVLLASTSEHDAELAAAAADGDPVMRELGEASSAAYRALVYEDAGFAGFFRRITPIAELSGLRIGSRPPARGRGAGTAAGSAAAAKGVAGVGGSAADRAPETAPSIDALRAIPWVFAWSQSRIDLPGWFGVGTALEAYRSRHGDAGLDRIADLYRRWPFVTSLLDHAELSLARADLAVARRYATLATEEGDAERWSAIEAEYERTVALLLRVTGRPRLLENQPALQRAIGLRNPYVDTLSELQVSRLADLRSSSPDDPGFERMRRLVQVTVNGVAAGLQTTG